MKKFNLEEYLKGEGVWDIAQQIGALELCHDPSFNEIISRQYDQFKDFKEGAYKTYTALDKETIDEFVDTITKEVFTGFVISKAIRTRSRKDNTMDIKAATEASYTQWEVFFILRLQDMNLDAQGAFVCF